MTGEGGRDSGAGGIEAVPLPAVGCAVQGARRVVVAGGLVAEEVQVSPRRDAQQVPQGDVTGEVLIPRAGTADQSLDQHPLGDDRIVRTLSGQHRKSGRSVRLRGRDTGVSAGASACRSTARMRDLSSSTGLVTTTVRRYQLPRPSIWLRRPLTFAYRPALEAPGSAYVTPMWPSPANPKLRR